MAARGGRNTGPSALEEQPLRDTTHENRACCEISTPPGRGRDLLGTAGTRPRREERERCSRDDDDHHHHDQMERPPARPSRKRHRVAPRPDRGRGREVRKRARRAARRMADRRRPRGVPAGRVPRARGAAGLHAKRYRPLTQRPISHSAFRFMPRIRDLPSKRLYVFEPKSVPGDLRGLIGGRTRQYTSLAQRPSGAGRWGC